MNRLTTCALASLSSAVFMSAALAKPPAEVPAEAKEAIVHAKLLSKAFRAVSSAVAPAVVSIQTSAPAYRQMGGGGMGGLGNAGGNVFGNLPPQVLEMLRQQGFQIAPNMAGPGTGPLGGGRSGGQMPQIRGEGTGFVIAQEGYILTNNHVVSNAATISVHFSDGRRAAATFVGSDPETDIAVIKVELDDLTPLAFADSDSAEVGDWVIALGSPFGLANSVTSGIISAKDRQVGLSPLENYLQTDATINPGNSGGPLVDMDGKVVGVNTAIESRSGGSDGIGFAIPAKIARSVVDSIMSGTAPSRGYLGVALQGMDEDLAATFNFSGSGVLVSRVETESPADKAGMHAGDIITKINGQATPTEASVHRAIRLCAAGTECPIAFVRDGEEMTVTAHLGDRAAALAAVNASNGIGTGQGGGTPLLRGGVRPPVVQPGSSAAPGTTAAAPADRIGLTVATIDEALAKERGIADAKGVLVTAVTAGGAGARAGLRNGDIIRKIGDEAVTQSDDFNTRVSSALSSGHSVRLLVERGGDARFVLLRGA